MGQVVVQISVDPDEFESAREAVKEFAEDVKAVADKSMGNDYEVIVNISTSDSVSR